MEQQVFDLGDRGGQITVIDRRVMSFGGGLEGAERTSRETVNWQASGSPPDRIINTVKEVADARASDLILNDGYARGAIQSHMDGIVGAQYRLNHKIVWRAIPCATAEWAAE